MWGETYLVSLGPDAATTLCISNSSSGIVRLASRDDDGKVIGVKYRHLTAVLVRALQEQQGEMDAIRTQTEQRLADLEAENARLRSLAERNADLEQRLAALEAVLLDQGDLAQAE